MNNDYVSVKEYAEKKGVTVQAVYQAMNRKTVSYKKIGTLTLVKME